MAASILMVIELCSYFPFDFDIEFHFSCYKKNYSLNKENFL